MDPSLEFTKVMSLVATLALFTTFVIPLLAHASPTEAQALLKWKSGLGNHSVASLSSWTPSPHHAISSNSTISPCAWYGISCNQAGSIIKINLTSAYVEGTLNEFPFSSLSHLTYMDLAINSLYGHIPPQIGLLSDLTYLDLSINRFMGNIPSEISHLTKLKVLHLFSNELNGSIPQEIGQLHLLNEVMLYSNQLTGSIPSSLGNLSKLARLYVYSNSLFGSIPPEMGNMANLEVLYMDNNTLTRPIPSILGNLTKFIELSLSGNFLMGSIPPELGNLNRLNKLSLSGNFLIGSIPSELGNLNRLNKLSLSGNSLMGSIPPTLGNLTELTFLYLYDNMLSGHIPNEIGNLHAMLDLNLSRNQLTGPIPSSLGNLTKLTSLYLSWNNFTGVLDLGVFSTLKNLQALNLTVELNLTYNSMNHTFPKLETLALSSCNLTEFPPFLNSFKMLRKLDLSKNKIGDQIPRWFWDVGKGTLQYLDISSNLIEGSIQQFPWKELIEVDLSHNLFQGLLPIPPLHIAFFRATDNSFSGEIPSSICKLSSLNHLWLARNNLSGYIPQCLGNLTNLWDLDLSVNKFEGTFPRSLNNCASLTSLNASHNRINDTFPKWLLEAPSLQDIDLQFNEFHGQIDPLSVPFHPSILYQFSIANNNLGGQWLEEYFLHWSNLRTVDLSNNIFEGPFPIPPPIAVSYSIANNKFSGKVSPLICNATELTVLDLSNNSLMGTLPECLMSFSENLSVLNLRMNMIQGVIPRKFAKDNILRTIDLSQNQFEGTLPRSLLHCENLEVLNLGNNRMKDTFPNWLETLPKLQVLVLRSNMFHGFMSSSREVRSFSELHIFDLSDNNLSGPLPIRYIMKLTAMMNQDKRQGKLQYMGDGNYQDSVTVTMKGLEIRLVKILTVFTSIDLSCNHFDGELPKDIGNLKSLKGLNFSHNNLTGYIPLSTGYLTELEWLDLSSNKFNGRIPQELADLTSLAFLNLSKNQLIGPIPQGRQFNTFKSDSFAENPGLCGFPLLETCTNNSREIPPVTILQENDTGHEGWFEWRAILMGYGCGTVGGVSLGYIVLGSRKFEWLVGSLERKGANMRKKWRRNVYRSYRR